MNIELIDEFRRRTNASYDEAKFYLERYNGELLEAIIAFERERTGQGHYGPHGRQNNGANIGGRLINGLVRVFQKLIDIKLLVTDNTLREYKIPLLLLIVLGPLWHILLVLAIIMLIIGFRFSFIESPDPNVNVSEFVEKLRNGSRGN